MNPKADGSWELITEQGNMIAEHVVNAAGLWAREVGELAGVYLPLHPMEHQYLATEAIDEVVNHHTELPHVMDPEGESYLRQEGQGLVIGFYEQDCDPWAVDGTSWEVEATVPESITSAIARIAHTTISSMRVKPLVFRLGDAGATARSRPPAGRACRRSSSMAMSRASMCGDSRGISTPTDALLIGIREAGFRRR